LIPSGRFLLMSRLDVEPALEAVADVLDLALEPQGLLEVNFRLGSLHQGRPLVVHHTSDVGSDVGQVLNRYPISSITVRIIGCRSMSSSMAAASPPSWSSSGCCLGDWDWDQRMRTCSPCPGSVSCAQKSSALVVKRQGACAGGSMAWHGMAWGKKTTHSSTSTFARSVRHPSQQVGAGIHPFGGSPECAVLLSWLPTSAFWARSSRSSRGSPCLGVECSAAAAVAAAVSGRARPCIC
jgi:hypothetical protein